MELQECFKILEIEKTTDQDAIKQVYRTKLVAVNPEDDPEGFKKLREAYDTAIRYARNPQEMDEHKEENPKKDTSPSGLWLSKAISIYKNIRTRQDTKAWTELFKDDTFVSLEEEENCRIKLLAYIMNHFRFPTEIWRLLDQNLHITDKTDELRERFPAEFVQFIAAKCERGEDIDFRDFEGKEDADYDLFLQEYDSCWNALQKKDYKEAAKAIENAEKLGITHPTLEVCRAYFLDGTGRTDEALDTLRSLHLRYPRDQIVQYNTAEFLWKNDHKEEASDIYEELNRENESHYMANLRLTEWYAAKGDYKAAKKCADKVLRGGVDEAFMTLLKKINQAIETGLEEDYSRNGNVDAGLELGWCYLQDGKINQGIRLVEGMTDIPDEKKCEYKGLLTKLYMEGTDSEAVLKISPEWMETLQERLASDEDEAEKERDRDRVRQYHFIRMHAFRIIGNMYMRKYLWNQGAEGDAAKAKELRSTAIENFRNALEEADQAKLKDSLDVSAEFEKALIYLDMEEYERSIEICERLITERRQFAAYATELEVYIKQLSAQGVAKAAKECIRYFPDFLRAYEQLGKLYLDFGMKEDMEKLLEDAKAKGLKSIKLEAYGKLVGRKQPDPAKLSDRIHEFRKDFAQKIEKGMMQFHFEAGEEIITDIFNDYPISYVLTERGYFYKEAHQYEKAKADFEKALIDEPYNPHILRGLGLVHSGLGNYEKALLYFKRAFRYRYPDLEEPLCIDLYETYSRLGDDRRALVYYGKFIYEGQGKKNFKSIVRYAHCLARCGEIKRAVQFIENAEVYEGYRLKELIYLHQLCGNLEESGKLLERWAKTKDVRQAAEFLSPVSVAADVFFKIIKPITSRRNKPTDFPEYMDYRERLCWQELLGGNMLGKNCNITKYLDIASKRSENGLCDAIFIAILTGNDLKGRHYARMLEKKLRGSKFAAADAYHDRKREWLRMRILADWYQNPASVKKLLSEEGQTTVCDHCELCVCKGIFALEVLFMIKNGEKAQAAARMKDALSKQPMDEYLLAIRNNIAL